MKHTAFSILIITLLLFPASAFPKKADHQPKLSLAAGICIGKAETLFADEKYLEAIKLLEDFIKNPKNIKSGQAGHPYFYYLLGNNYAMQLLKENEDQNRRNAIKNYQAAVRVDPDFGAAWLNLAKYLYEAEDYSAAAQAFESAWRTAEEKKAIYLYYSAVCYLQAEQNEKALAAITSLFKNHPDAIPLEWKETHVHILFALERYKTALPHVEELAQKSAPPKKKKWQEILLQQYLNLGMTEKALVYAKSLTRTDPLEPKWWKALAHIQLEKNQLEKGLAALVIYGYLEPLTENEKALVADLYFSLDIPQKASILYQEIFKGNHKPETLEKLTRALTLSHNPDQALKWIDQGLGLIAEKDMPPLLQFNLLSAKARILYLKKSWDAAAKTYQAAARHAEKPGQTLLMAGYAYMNGENLTAAETEFKKASKFKKQKKDALAAIRQIDILKKQMSESFQAMQ